MPSLTTSAKEGTATKEEATTTTKTESKSNTTTAKAESNDTNDNNNNCWICKKNPIAYSPDPCGCPIYCKNCAMKFATGGRCRKCKSMFGGMRQIRIFQSD